MRLFRAITQFTQKEIELLFSTARRVVSQKSITVLRSPKQKSIGRVLIVIPKKVGNAPERNKLRRQIKAIFYKHKLFQKDYDWVVLCRLHATQISFDQLKELFPLSDESPNK